MDWTHGQIFENPEAIPQSPPEGTYVVVDSDTVTGAVSRFSSGVAYVFPATSEGEADAIEDAVSSVSPDDDYSELPHEVPGTLHSKASEVGVELADTTTVSQVYLGSIVNAEAIGDEIQNPEDGVHFVAASEGDILSHQELLAMGLMAQYLTDGRVTDLEYSVYQSSLNASTAITEDVEMNAVSIAPVVSSGVLTPA